MPTKLIQISEIPETVNVEITKPLVDYSVALSRVRGDDARTFTPLGSGTLVRRGDKQGILTAHHCLHRAEPEVRLGANGTDTLVLMLTRGRSILIRAFEVVEQSLAAPVSDEWGPDLTFIEIPPGPRLESVRAVGSFWNLDEPMRQRGHGLCKGHPIIVNVGYPELDYETAIRGNDIHHTITHMGFIGALADGDIIQRAAWDYIASHANRKRSPTLPATFKGLSGGGIWAVQLRASAGGVWTVDQFSLVGVTFYESPEVDHKRDLRGHFIDTIYSRAWRV